jgi:ribosome biogenesis GTPase / thiamine phosphate phosphatase
MTGKTFTTLERLGWDLQWQDTFKPHAAKGLAAGRIVAEHRGRYQAAAAFGDLHAEGAGSLYGRAVLRSDLPAVGDFVALRPPTGDGPALIQAVMPRRSAFVRKAAGIVTNDQVVAANIDVAVIIEAVDGSFNPRRLDRYMALARSSGVAPVVLLNKADQPSDAMPYLQAARISASGAPVHKISARTGLGIEELQPYLCAGRTIVVLGPSGVGKSTLINRLVGDDLQATGEVRRVDHRGRHTTTSRHLVRGPGGSLLIDTPGMRELQLWLADERFGSAFQDVEELSTQCRYRDCRHDTEPGCTVRAAVARGDLDPARLKSHEKMVRELRRAEALDDIRSRRDRKLTLKRQIPKKKYGRSMR